MDKRKYMDRKEYMKKYYKEYYKNPEKKTGVLASRKKTAQKNRKAFLDWKSTLSCEICGENHVACLEFHHVNPDEKDFTLSKMSNKSLKYLQKEAEKCKVLCANCHRKLHYPSK